MSEKAGGEDLSTLGVAIGDDAGDADVDPDDGDGGEAEVDPAILATLVAVGSAMLDACWQERLAAVRAARVVRRAAPMAPPRPRAELLARLAVLHTRYPTLTAHHRNLSGASDDTLGAMIEDIEAVTGDRGA